MEPNANQPPDAGQQQFSPGEWPPRAHQIPDWQRGLVGVPGQQPPMPGQAYAPEANDTLPLPTPGAQDVSEQPLPPMSPAPLVPAGVTPAPRPRRLRKILAGLLVLVVLGGALAAAWIWWSAQDKPSDSKTPSTSQAKAPVPLATLQKVTFGLPDDLTIFKGDSSPGASYHVYLTQGSTDEKACSLEFGTVAADQLPGDTLDGIIGPQVENLKQAGATVDGPHNGADLVLHDGRNTAVTYSMPTLKYAFTKDGKHVTVNYSLAILQNGERAVISRQCASTSAQTDTATLAKIEAAAKQITVHQR